MTLIEEGVVREWRTRAARGWRAPTGALVTALFNQPIRLRNGSRAGAVGVSR